MTIKTAANTLAAAWAAGRFHTEAESRKSPEAGALRSAIVEAGMRHKHLRIAAAVLRRHGLTSKVYTT